MARQVQAPQGNLRFYDGLCAFEYGMGFEVFGLARPEFDQWRDLTRVAAEPGLEELSDDRLFSQQGRASIGVWKP